MYGVLLKCGTVRNVPQRRNTLFPTERIITAYTRIAYRHIIAQLLESIITLSDIRLEELCQIFVLKNSVRYSSGRTLSDIRPDVLLVSIILCEIH